MAKRVLLIVEDAGLSELLAEALRDAGHTPVLDEDSRAVDAAIVDLDTRARNGAAVIAELRERMPDATLIALLPCGGLPTGIPVGAHRAIEKPARLQAVLSAVQTARGRAAN
jgi:ActR/RegA family two-component response regulator